MKTLFALCLCFGSTAFAQTQSETLEVSHFSESLCIGLPAGTSESCKDAGQDFHKKFRDLYPNYELFRIKLAQAVCNELPDSDIEFVKNRVQCLENSRYLDTYTHQDSDAFDSHTVIEVSAADTHEHVGQCQNVTSVTGNLLRNDIRISARAYEECLRMGLIKLEKIREGQL